MGRRYVKGEATCPGPDCWMCNGEACALCGAGCSTGFQGPHCDHDVLEWHQEETDGAGWWDYAVARTALSDVLGTPVESAAKPCRIATWTVGGKRVRLTSDGWVLSVTAGASAWVLADMRERGEATTPLPDVVAAVRAWVGIGAGE